MCTAPASSPSTSTLSLRSGKQPACLFRLKDLFDKLNDVEMHREASRYLYLHHYGGAGREDARRGMPLLLVGAARLTKARSCCKGIGAWLRTGVRAGPGVFADSRLTALRSVEELVRNHQLLLAATSADSQDGVSNLWLASTRKHPFWLFTVVQMLEAGGALTARCVAAAADLARAWTSHRADADEGGLPCSAGRARKAQSWRASLRTMPAAPTGVHDSSCCACVVCGYVTGVLDPAWLSATARTRGMR